jgi:CRISPR/Cas system-associated exonuclease Cas4 (RecB family)
MVERSFKEHLEQSERGPIPLLWPDADSRDRMIEQGRELLRLYLETVPLHRVLAVEVPFVVEPRQLPRTYTANEPLAGVVDLVEQDADGTVWITELKTATRRFDENRLRFDLQMGIYAAARAALGHLDAKLRFRVLLRNRNPSIETHEVVRSEEHVSEVGTVVSGVMRAVEAGAFYPLRSWICGTCPYRDPCGG